MRTDRQSLGCKAWDVCMGVRAQRYASSSSSSSSFWCRWCLEAMPCLVRRSLRFWPSFNCLVMRRIQLFPPHAGKELRLSFSTFPLGQTRLWMSGVGPGTRVGFLPVGPRVCWALLSVFQLCGSGLPPIHLSLRRPVWCCNTMTMATKLTGRHTPVSNSLWKGSREKGKEWSLSHTVWPRGEVDLIGSWTSMQD